jgi:predicted RNase H-like HicB family nuclease
MDDMRHGVEEMHVCVRFEDGSFWATVDEFPGVFASGDNLEELRESLQEGIALWLGSPEHGTPSVKLSPLEAGPIATQAKSELEYA